MKVEPEGDLVLIVGSHLRPSEPEEVNLVLIVTLEVMFDFELELLGPVVEGDLGNLPNVLDARFRSTVASSVAIFRHLLLAIIGVFATVTTTEIILEHSLLAWQKAWHLLDGRNESQ